MKYLMISQSGILTEHHTDDPMAVLAAVGPEGANRVQLTRTMAAWVNDCGLILPDRYQRNPIGGALLIAFGAQVMPYGGPVVLSGWDERATARGDYEVVGLDLIQEAAVRLTHGWIAGALVGHDLVPAHPPTSESTDLLAHLYDVMTDGDTPGWTVHTS